MAKNQKKKEFSEIEKSFNDITGNRSRKSSGKGGKIALIICCVVMALVLATLTALCFFTDLINPQTIDCSAKIANIDISGMTRDDAISAVNTQLANKYASQTLVLTVGEQTVELTPEVSGVKLDTEKLVDDILAENTDNSNVDLIPYLNLNEASIRAALEALLPANNEEMIPTTYEVSGAYDATTGVSDMQISFQIGQPGKKIELDTLYAAVLGAYRTACLQISCTPEVIPTELPDLQAILNEYGAEPVDATIDPQTSKLTPHAYGVSFDVEEVANLLANAIPNSTEVISFEILKPNKTTEDMGDVLFKDVLGTYTAKSSSHPNTRDVNLALSCEKINGIVLNPGELFDYNATLGERTGEKGWKKADGYENGATVSVYGGGICQASSSLYYCALIADLEIVSRTNHSYVSSYMPLGMDATVSWGGPELRIRNNTQFPIRIDATAKGGTVTVSIMGTDTKDYYVEMEYEVLGYYPFSTVEKKMTSKEAGDHADGSQLQSGYTGQKVVTYKCKYDKVTKELISREEEAVSNYKKRDRVIVKIVDSTTTTEPTTPSTTPTETPEPTTQPTTQPTTPPTTQPTETQPDETQPVETQPVETQPGETQPVETQPDDTQPVETQPVETQPTDPPAPETDVNSGE